MNAQSKTVDLSGKKRPGEALIVIFLIFAAGVSILTTVGIVFILGKESLPFFREVSLLEFFTKPRWQPQIHDFGILPLFTAPAFNNEVQKGRGLNPSPVATKTCIVCLPQKQNAGASPWKGIPQKSRKSIHI